MAYTAPGVEYTRWTDDEDAYLKEYGAQATAEATGRTYASCQSRYNRKGWHLTREDVAPGDDGLGAIEPPVVEQIVGVMAGESFDLQEAIDRHKRQFNKVRKSHERKHQQHVYLSGSPAMVALFSDQHTGSPHTDLDRMFKEQAMVMETPGAYVALGGDIVDNYVIGKLIAQNMFHTVAVSEEWQIAKSYVDKFEDRLLWVHSGNHPQWATKLIGVDIDRTITPDGVLYDQDEILVNLHVGPHSYLIRSRHKWGGSSLYNPTHGLERAARFDNAAPDIFIGAHVHKGAIVRNFVLGGKRKTAILTGTYKGGSDTYGRQEGFPANDGSTGVAIVFFPDGTYHAFDSIPAACQVMKALYRGAA